MPSFLIPLVLIHLVVMVRGFGFTASTPTECDDLTVTWSGGQPPFRLLIFKPGSPVINISIPSTAYQNSQGSFTTTLELPHTHSVLFSMSDATGITAGGISDAMVVGPSVSGASCNLTDPGEDFYFSLPYSPVQCKPYPITALSGAVLPINVLVVVALGQSIFLQAPVGSIFTWDAVNITVNSQVTFVVTDASGRTGGSSPLYSVQYSDDASCISAAAIPSSSIPARTGSSITSYPSSSSPSNISTSKGEQTSGSNANSTTSHSSSHVGVIAGATAGGLVALIIIILLLWCQRKKSRDSNRRETDLTPNQSGVPTPTSASYLLPDHYASTPLLSNSDSPPRSRKNVSAAPDMNQIHPYTPQQYEQFASYPATSQGYGRRTVLSFDSEQRQSRHETLPLSLASSSNTAPSHQRSLASMQQSFVSEFGSRLSTVSDGQSSGPAYGGNQSSQVIVHADIEEVTEPLELPPQYSEHRTPIPGFTVSGVGASSTAKSSRKVRGLFKK